MASYRDKINQKKMATESGKIAWCIQFIEHPPLEFKTDYYDDLLDGDIPLFDDFLLSTGPIMIYIIYRPVEYKANRYYAKYVQQGMNYNQMVKMLDAQPWQYI